jgi:uroporphyrinogen decarboxylase
MMAADDSCKLRMIKAMHHEVPDRVPVIANLSPPVAEKLIAFLGLDYDAAPFKALNTLISGRASYNDLLVHLGNDCIGIAAESITDPDAATVPGLYSDEWGLSYQNESGYLEVVSRPLAAATTTAEIRNYVIPDPALLERWRTASLLVSRYGESHAVMGCMGQTMFEMCWNLVGFEKFLMDFMTGEEYIAALFDRLLEYAIVHSELLISAGSDVIFLGDDVGMQSGMLLAPELWRASLKPRLAKLCGHIRSCKPSVKIAYHSCGSIAAIIPDLVEMGIDILNPVQPLAHGMELAALKMRYGNKLVFYGGIDVQQCIPFGTIEEISRQVQQAIKDASASGGFIIAPAHIIPSETSPENVLAFFNAVKLHGRY